MIKKLLKTLQISTLFLFASVSICLSAITYPGTSATGANCGISTTLNANSFTIYALVNRTGAGVTASTGSGGLTAIEPILARAVGEADGSNVDGNWFLGYIPASNKFGADFEDLNTGLNHPITCTTAQSGTGVYSVFVTYDGGASDPGNWACYVNGVADGTATVTSATLNVRKPRDDSIQQVGIGVAINSTGTRTGGWKGDIIEAAFWKNKVLTAAEIDLIYKTKIKGFVRQIQPGSLTGYWQLAETSNGSSVSASSGAIKDLSGSSNNCTEFGSATGKADDYLTYQR